MVRPESLLRVGTFGVVCEGRWKGLRVAVKSLLLQDHSAATKARQRAMQEAAISMAVGKGFPHILATYHHELRPMALPAGSAARREAGLWMLYIVQVSAAGRVWPERLAFRLVVSQLVPLLWLPA